MSEHPKFCTSCGAPLEPGQKFCTSCGAQVIDPAASASSGPGDTSPMPVVNAAPAQQSKLGDTQVLPVADVRTRQYLQSNSPKKDSTPSSNGLSKKVLVIAIVALAVVVCVLVGVLFGMASNNNSNGQASPAPSSEQTSTNDNASAASSSDTSDKAPTASSSSSDDKELYSTLAGYYDRLGSYDSAISDAAKSFNSNYMSKSSSTRSSYAESASSLQESIAQDYSSLKSLTVPSNSRYSSCYSAMLTCYHDCTQRIGVIVEAWGNSLKYSDPTGHSDEICAPLSRDKSGNSNKYFTEFNQTYPSAKPSAPDAHN